MKKINNSRDQGVDNILILEFLWNNAHGEFSDDNLSSPNYDLPDDVLKHELGCSRPHSHETLRSAPGLVHPVRFQSQVAPPPLTLPQVAAPVRFLWLPDLLKVLGFRAKWPRPLSPRWLPQSVSCGSQTCSTS
jgi:hypothetical protein